jgi:hypothetical protein
LVALGVGEVKISDLKASVYIAGQIFDSIGVVCRTEPALIASAHDDVECCVRSPASTSPTNWRTWGAKNLIFRLKHRGTSD